MNDTIEIAYVFDGPPQLRTLREIFEKITDHRYSQSTSTDLDIAYWDESGDTHTKLGTAEDAANICLECQSAMVTIDFDGFQLEIGPNYDRDELSEVPHLLVSEQIHPFTRADTESLGRIVRQRRQHFVEILTEMGCILDPIWSFGRRGGVSIESEVLVTELAASSTPPLYEYNLFDERVVNAIGREKITSAPAWYVKELETGDVFLVTREPPYSCSPHEQNCIEVADHLGLSIPDLS